METPAYGLAGLGWRSDGANARLNSYENKNDHVVVFYGVEFTLATAASREIEEIVAFDLRDLPADLSPGTRRRLAEHVAAPGWPVTANW